MVPTITIYYYRRMPLRAHRRAGAPARFVGRRHGFSVFLVDGETVRRDIEIDFTMGGNGAVYPFVPKNEIWIDNCLSPLDATATILHELIEFRLMNGEGLSYSKAHDLASEEECELRRKLEGRRLRKIDLELAFAT